MWRFSLIFSWPMYSDRLLGRKLVSSETSSLLGLGEIIRSAIVFLDSR